MDEVDGIIIRTLKELDCDIEEGVDSLKFFTTEMVVEAMVKCLKILNPSLQMATTLPPSMSARYKIGGAIARACADLGYSGEIGYQTVLYSNETEIRKIFIYLLEKLPKDTDKLDTSTDRATHLDEAISKKVSEELSKPWTPSYFTRKHAVDSDDSWRGFEDTTPFSSCVLTTPPDLRTILETLPKETAKYYVANLPFIHLQPPSSRLLLPSLIADHESRLAQTEDLKTAGKGKSKVVDTIRRELERCQPTEAPAELRTLERVVPVATQVQAEPDAAPTVPSQRTALELQDETNSLRNKLEDMQNDVAKLTDFTNRLEGQVLLQEAATVEREHRYDVDRQMREMIPNADANVAKLEGLVESASKRLLSLAEQWEKRRTPLVQTCRDGKAEKADRHSETRRQFEEIKEMQEKVKDLARQAQNKDNLHKQLTIEYEKMAKDVNRTSYTRRIVEIINNIKKQSEEIDRVLVDTREIQKEINQLGGKLDRTFAVADEVIFRDAKKDEVVRKAYKLLATLHGDCGELVKMIEETGAILREIRDLEDQIETENGKKVGANLERITADLQQMKQENAALVIQLKNTSS